MALLNILKYPDPRLKTIAQPVASFDRDLSKLVEDMFETMYEEQGVGLAATQVNIHQRVIVIDISKEANTPLHLINPEFIKQEGAFEWDEGCLSFPGVWSKVKRYKSIVVKYFDKEGREKTIEASNNLLCACLQHEVDHLNGVTFFDHLSRLKQDLLQKKMDKLRRRAL